MVRRLLAATMIAALMLVGACNTGETSEKSGSADAPTTASPSPTRADNTKKVCDDMKALAAELTAKVTALLQRAVQEGLSGDEAKAEKTFEELNAVAVEYAGKVEAIGQTSSNPELKQALIAMATEMRAAQGEDLDSAITAGEEKYKAICGA